jgi:hypothetical protein
VLFRSGEGDYDAMPKARGRGDPLDPNPPD